jgi:amidohydrolase
VNAPLPTDPSLRDDLVSLRRALHAAAEVGLHLPRTQRLVLDALAGLDLEVTTGNALSSVTAVLRGAQDGPVVLLRADMDALPIVEATGLAFASPEPAMHACGHDLHMAGLIGAARMLAARRAELAGTVVFMFQPGEEGFAGGRLMIEEGVLDAAGARPVAAYAVHVDCVTPREQAVTRQGAMMAGVGMLRVRIGGTGGHAAFPHHAIDPVPVAAEIVLALQSFAARRVPAAEPAVISVTRLSTDSPAANVLPTSVELDANIRTVSPGTLALVRDQLPALVRAIGEAHGCSVRAEFEQSYPVTVNDPAETGQVLDFLDRRFPGDVVRLPAPSMASEDFSYVLEEVPGALVFLGVRPEGVDDEGAPPMHSDQAVFDDGLLDTHAAVLAELALERLRR